jgi:hypothetical protein
MWMLLVPELTANNPSDQMYTPEVASSPSNE